MGELLLAAIGYLRSYAPEMGDAKLTCEGGCSCDKRDSGGPDLLEGWHRQHTSVTWVNWIALRLRAPLEDTGGACPCTVHVTTQRRPVQRGTIGQEGGLKFKVNMAMLTHDGRMDWIDPFKVQTLAVGDVEPNALRGRRM